MQTSEKGAKKPKPKLPISREKHEKLATLSRNDMDYWSTLYTVVKLQVYR